LIDSSLQKFVVEFYSYEYDVGAYIGT